jgi:hypothetical protein
MIDWKHVAKIEHGYGLRLYDEYHECQEELNRHVFPGGAELRIPTRKEALRPARIWAAIVQKLERQLSEEREFSIRLRAELEGWKDEALGARCGALHQATTDEVIKLLEDQAQAPVKMTNAELAATLLLLMQWSGAPCPVCKRPIITLSELQRARWGHYPDVVHAECWPAYTK